MEIQFPSEEFIESYICEKLEEDYHCPLSGNPVDISFRQPDLGCYGFADIVTIERGNCEFYNQPIYTITVIEIKNAPLKAKDFSQLKRYMKGIEDQAKRYARKLGAQISITGILAGLNSNEDDFVFLADSFSNIDTYYIWADLDNGFLSKSINTGGWHRSGKSFKNISTYAKECARWQG